MCLHWSWLALKAASVSDKKAMTSNSQCFVYLTMSIIIPEIHFLKFDITISLASLRKEKNVRIAFGFTFLLVSLLTVEQNMFWEAGLVVVLYSVGVVLVLQKMSQSETAWGPKCLCKTSTQRSKSALKKYHTNTTTKTWVAYGNSHLVFTCLPGESYRRRVWSLLLCLCDILQALSNFPVCWFLQMMCPFCDSQWLW